MIGSVYAEADLIRKKSEPLNIAIESAMPGKIGVADFFFPGEPLMCKCATPAILHTFGIR